MIEKRTVFILGAGVSCPYGFPTAGELRTAILAGLSGWYGVLVDREARRAHEGYPDIPVVLEFLNEFRGSNADSVDLFLSRWPRFQTIGKLAILLGILQKEKNSCSDDKAKDTDRDWYFHLYKRLAGDLTGRDGYQGFGRNKIAFITFNYDRSLEHFLFESLVHSFEGADTQAVKSQIDRIPIVHVYGRLAPLPWQEDDKSKVVGYGDYPSVSPGNALGMIGNLFVVYEERTSPALEEARKHIQAADRIFFLGFGYAKENLEVLGFPDVLKPSHQIFGTAMGWNAREVADITHDFVSGLQRSGNGSASVGDRVKIRDYDCVHLLHEFL
jgi:hypothetical protein